MMQANVIHVAFSNGVRKLFFLDSSCIYPRLTAGPDRGADDLRYFRPTEVDTLLGDSSRARQNLGSVPQIAARQECQ